MRDQLRHRLSQGLSRLLGDHAPGSIKEQKFENYFGRKIAVDASMHIYSFLVRVLARQQERGPAQQLILAAPRLVVYPGGCTDNPQVPYPCASSVRGLHASCACMCAQVVVGRTGDQLLTSEAGDVTSHLQGMFFRTARMLEAGMKPV